MNYFRWVLRQVKDIRTNVLVSIIAGMAQVGASLLLVELCRHFIDQDVWSDEVTGRAVLLFAVLVTSIGLRQSVLYLRETADIRQQNAIRERLFRQLLARRMYTSAERLHSGDIGQRLTKDIETVAEISTDVIPRLFVTIIQLSGAFLLLHSMDTMLAWSLLILTPFIIVCAKFLARHLRRMTLDIRTEESRLHILIQETIEQESTMKALESQPLLAARMERMHRKLHELVIKRIRFTLTSRLLMATTFGIGYIGAFIYGGLQLRAGSISVGTMTAFLQLVNQIQIPILSLLNMLPQILHATASIERLHDIETMDRENSYGEEKEKPGRQPTETARLEPPIGLHMDNVTYHYPCNNQPVLNHFCYDFQPGTWTAVTGSTGHGKTTLLRLALGIIQPDAGRVELYDSCGRTVSGTAMRSYITYIPQGDTLLSGTVRDNLLLAAPDASDKDLYRALHTAVADFVWDLPEGLDTQIGEHAARLSEGQIQRIAIARGLLRQSEVMLLDEISSSLDAVTEKELLKRLHARYPERTTIFVTHRQEAASFCKELLRMPKRR